MFFPRAIVSYLQAMFLCLYSRMNTKFHPLKRHCLNVKDLWGEIEAVLFYCWFTALLFHISTRRQFSFRIFYTRLGLKFGLNYGDALKGGWCCWYILAIYLSNISEIIIGYNGYAEKLSKLTISYGTGVNSFQRPPKSLWNRIFG